MVTDESRLCFVMEVGDGGNGVASRGDPQCSVLDTLERVDRRIAGIGDPNCGSVIHDGFDIGLIGLQHHLLLAAPARPGQGAKRPKLLAGRPDDVHGVGAKGEVGVEVDSEDARGFVERDGYAGDQNLRMDA